MQVKILSEEDDIVRILVNDNVIAFYDVKVSGKDFIKYKKDDKFVDYEKYTTGFFIFDVNEENPLQGVIENFADGDVFAKLF